MSNGIESRTTGKGVKRYRGAVKVDGKLKRGPWGSHAEARSWRSKALGEIEAGTAAADSPQTLREAWDAFLTAAQAGTGTRSYRPSTLRAYAYAWKRVDPELGAHKLTAIRKRDLQALVDRWAAAGVPPATIRNSLDPVRAVYRHALNRDLVAVNPTTGLELPKVDNARERFATKPESQKLLDALTEDRALWATAFYTGLRRGELRALRWDHIDFKSKTINVQRSWDDAEGDGPPKTKAAVRRIHIGTKLMAYLKAHKAATGRGGAALVFGRTADVPFATSSVDSRAKKTWKNAKLAPITLHECRHTFASWLIASGAEAKALSVVMGHESISITYDRYGKLMPGAEAAVGAALDKYLDAVE